MPRRSFVVGVCLTLALASGSAQQPAVPSPDATPVFRSGIDIVELDVSVLDKDRMPVRGLTAADFTVLDDGKPQPIVAFDAVDLPEWTQTSAPWMRDVASDVVTNRLGTERVIAMILKDVRVPLSEMQDTKRIAREIVDGMGPNDVAAVVYTFQRDKGQEFTSDRARLLAAIDRFNVAFGDDTRIANPFSASERGPQSDPMTNDPRRKPGPATEACPGDSCVTQAMRNAAEILRKWPGGRKTMVLVSPAIRTGAGATPAGQMSESQKNDSKETFAAMQEANANLYQIDPLGLQVAPRPLIDPTTTLAEQTGGRVLTGANNPWRLVPQMFRESGSYYLLGFRRTNAAADGSFHRLTVRVARPDLEVRTRAGYFAPSPTNTATSSATPAMSPLDAAVARGLPTGDLPMTLTVAPFAVPGKTTAALAIVAGIDPSAQAPDSEVVEVRTSVFQTDWNPAGSETQTVEVKRPVPGAAFHADVSSRLDLAPGRYEVRVAIESRTTGRTGSAYITAIVPDFFKEPVSLSGIVITRGTAKASPGEMLSSLLPVAPTTIREFPRSAAASAFLRVYQGGNGAIVEVPLSIRIRDDRNATVFETSERLNASRFDATRAADFRLVLPIEKLVPGAYLLTVEGKLKKETVRRDVRFQVHADASSRDASLLSPDLTQTGLDSVLARLRSYLTAYAERYASTIATEHYRQTYAKNTRTLESQFGIVRLPGRSQWLAFRDVTRVNGKPVADRDDRLASLFQNRSEGALKQADKITEESTRFNVGPVRRTVNNPAIVLDALDARNQGRFIFSKRGEETIDGTPVWVLRFVEKTRPTFITTSKGENHPLTGRAWVDPDSGRLLRAEIDVAAHGQIAFNTTIDVIFHEDARLRLWVPATMTERYTEEAREIASGTATYSDYRQFDVETKEELAK